MVGLMSQVYPIPPGRVMRFIIVKKVKEVKKVKAIPPQSKVEARGAG